jgi:Uma2 family endonuclease
MSALLEAPPIIAPPPPKRIGPWSNGITLTPEEFDAIDDWKEGYRYELIQGVLIVSPMPAKGERSPNDILGYYFHTYRFSHPQGAALEDTVTEETLQLVSNRRRADRVIWLATAEARDLSTVLPEIVIEFVSKRKRDQHRDYVLKREEYVLAGVKEYWVIDRFRRTLTAYRGIDTEIAIHPGEFYTTPLLPGFELPLDPLLAAADKWNRPRKTRT